MNQNYTRYTQNWKSLVASKDVFTISNYLNSGFSFHISYNEYHKMKMQDSKLIHYYFAIINKQFKVLVIDDVADKKGDHTNVLIKDLSNKLHEDTIGNIDSGDYSIPLKVALERSFRWKLFSHNWIEYMLKNSKYKEHTFPLIINPISDLDLAFKNNKKALAYHFFGLKDVKSNISTLDASDSYQYEIHPMENYMIDIIVTNITDSDTDKGEMGDVSCPGGTKFIEQNTEDFSLLPS